MKPSVLIVDDHEGFRVQVREMLGWYGYQVVGEAADGRSALAAVAALDPDVVLLDVQLPDADGFDLAERLLAEGMPPRVVLVSAREARSYRSRLARAPGVPFVHKADLSRELLEHLLSDD